MGSLGNTIGIGLLTPILPKPVSGTASASQAILQQQKQAASDTTQAQNADGDIVTLSRYAGNALYQNGGTSDAGSSHYSDASAYYTTIRQLSQSLAIDSSAVSSQAYTEQPSNGAGLTQLKSSAVREHLNLSYDLEALTPGATPNLNLQLLSSTSLSTADAVSFGLNINGNTLELGRVQLATGTISLNKNAPSGKNSGLYFYGGSDLFGDLSKPAADNTQAIARALARPQGIQAATETAQGHQSVNFDLALDAQGNITTDASAAAYALHLHFDHQESAVRSGVTLAQSSDVVAVQASVENHEGDVSLHASAFALQSNITVVQTSAGTGQKTAAPEPEGQSVLPPVQARSVQLINLIYIKAQYQQATLDLQKQLFA